MASIKPHFLAVGGSRWRLVRASQAVRWRPMRRGRLTVPPAPGSRPRRTSGSQKNASGVEVMVLVKAGSSMPAPTQAPWRFTRM